MAISNPSQQFGNSKFVVDPTLGVGSYQTITAALAASSSGDTIYIRPGTYTENLTANLGGRTLIGATVGTNAFSVQIVGNHSFTQDASTCAFQSVQFTASSGSAWTVGSSGAGNSSLYLEGCKVINSGGIGLTISSAGGTGSVQAFFCNIQGSTIGIQASNGTLRLEGGTVTGTASYALQASTSMTVTASNQDFVSSAGAAVFISSASAVLNSEISSYTAAGAAFSYSANGTITSISDTVASSNGSGLFSVSSGAYGQLQYAAMVLSGTAKSIDPQVTASALPVIASSGMVTSNVTGNAVMESNHNYFVTANTPVLTLPAISTAGDTIVVTLAGGTSWSIAQTAGQLIVLGSAATTVGVGGSLASSAAGDSVTLRCQTANQVWYVQSVVGNITVT